MVGLNTSVYIAIPESALEYGMDPDYTTMSDMEIFEHLKIRLSDYCSTFHVNLISEYIVSPYTHIYQH